MAVSAGTPRQPTAATFPPIPFHRKLYGFGSIYGKTIRDSRLTFIIAAGLLGGMSLVMGVAVSNIFPTEAARKEVDALFGSIPTSMMNLFGNVELIGDKVGTLGGYVTFKYGAIFALGVTLWSVFALSGTLAGEARRGSLDLVAVTPFGKRRIALEKLAAHLTLLALALVVLAVMLTFSSNVFGEADLGDAIPLQSSGGFALWIGSLALLFGGLALALSPLLGRAGAAGVAGLAMAATWIMTGMDVGGPLLALSPFTWTFDHVPLVGTYDWPSLALVAGLGVLLLAVGVELFARRDLGVTAGLSLPSLPAPVLGVHGPTARAFGEQLPRALSWGIGLGLIGILYSSLSGVLADQLGSAPSFQGVFEALFPGIDLASVGGWLQLYAELLYIVAGFAATTLVAKWAADETEGRLDTLLATPMARSRWVVAGGIAAVIGMAVATVLFAAGVGLGSASAGLAAGEAMLGTAALGLYGAAIVGVGFAVGGLWRTSLAAEVAALVVVATYLLDLVAPALQLPDPIHQLALTAHLGKPMVGQWDPVGIVACIVIAVGGIAIGAWGMRRRDVSR